MPDHLSWGRFFGGGAPVRATTWHDRHGYHDHQHDFLELVVLRAGSAVHRGPGGERPITAGDLLVLRPGAWHGYAGGRGLAGHDVCIAPTLLGHELAWTVDDPRLGRLLWRGPLAGGGLLILHLGPPAARRAGRLCRDLLALGGDGPEADGERLGLLLQLCGLAARALPAEARPPAPPHPAVAAALRLIEGGLDRPWTLSGLALRCQVEATYLARIFRRALGLPPMAWLARRRMEAAAGLLMRTDEAVGAIGARVGYDDANLFTRRFKAVMGVSPGGYRRRGLFPVTGGSTVAPPPAGA